METLSKQEGDPEGHPYVIQYIKGSKLDVVINVPEGTKRDEEVTIGWVRVLSWHHGGRAVVGKGEGWWSVRGAGGGDEGKLLLSAWSFFPTCATLSAQRSCLHCCICSDYAPRLFHSFN